MKHRRSGVNAKHNLVTHLCTRCYGTSKRTLLHHCLQHVPGSSAALGESAAQTQLRHNLSTGKLCCVQVRPAVPQVPGVNPQLCIVRLLQAFCLSYCTGRCTMCALEWCWHCNDPAYCQPAHHVQYASHAVLKAHGSLGPCWITSSALNPPKQLSQGHPSEQPVQLRDAPAAAGPWLAWSPG